MNDVETQRSITGITAYFRNNIVDWSSKQQTLVSHSTAESEYVAADAAAKMLIWLGSLLQNLGMICEYNFLVFRWFFHCIKPCCLHEYIFILDVWFNLELFILIKHSFNRITSKIKSSENNIYKIRPHNKCMFFFIVLWFQLKVFGQYIYTSFPLQGSLASIKTFLVVLNQ